MNEQLSDSRWLNTETARRYQLFTRKTTMYQDLSQVMLDLAQVEPDQCVLDLGCGTGVTTKVALACLGERGRVYALDVSGPMLAIARQQIDDARVVFLEADAADAPDLVSRPVDRILCNSVFWQLRHKSAVLSALRQVIAPGGKFIFNVPEPYLIFQQIPRSTNVSTLFKQLAAERYGVGPQDLRTMEILLNGHGFRTVSTKEYTRIRSAEESYLFYQLPVATAWMEPPLDYSTRLALLEEARQMTGPGKPLKQRWMYFVVEPVV
jgi:ubiquinone/menaquinone biosynthesis C-methylase UbiE